MSEPRIQLQHVGAVAVITLSHPATLNAISITLVEEHDKAIDTPTVTSRAILLTSRARAFSSGGALNDEIAKGSAADRISGAALETNVNPR